MRIVLCSEVNLVRPFRAFSIALFVFVPAIFFVYAPLAQTPARNTLAVDTVVTQTKATSLRDAFTARVRAAGFKYSISVPTIVVEAVPSFGQYQSETNVLRTSDWSLLRPEEKALFVHLADPGKDEPEARKLFEVAAHQWIFIHELGHWWQACSGGNAERSHYQVEYGANRISLAYWREVNPEVAETMKPVFQGVVDHAPSPVPPGQSVEEYFNANYETLGPSPAYPWFMSRMNVAAFEEKPVPTFAAALASQQQ
jgi:hypothetical protein